MTAKTKAVSITWNHVSDKPLVDWNEDKSKWVESNFCPTGIFLAGLYVENKEKNTVNFEWYSVVLTEDGIREVADGDNFYIGWEVEDFEFWAEMPTPDSEPTYTQSERDAYAREAIKADRERVVDNAKFTVTPSNGMEEKTTYAIASDGTVFKIDRSSILKLPIELPKIK